MSSKKKVPTKLHIALQIMDENKFSHTAKVLEALVRDERNRIETPVRVVAAKKR